MTKAQILLSSIKQVVLYLGLVIGIFFSDAVVKFGATNGTTLDPETLFTLASLGRMGISFILALVIMPQVYEKLTVSPNSPFICQFGLFVQNGVFWSVTINAFAHMMK